MARRVAGLNEQSKAVHGVGTFEEIRQQNAGGVLSPHKSIIYTVSHIYLEL
jgi:hypothetical protein